MRIVVRIDWRQRSLKCFLFLISTKSQEKTQPICVDNCEKGGDILGDPVDFTSPCSSIASDKTFSVSHDFLLTPLNFYSIL